MLPVAGRNRARNETPSSPLGTPFAAAPTSSVSVSWVGRRRADSLAPGDRLVWVRCWSWARPFTSRAALHRSFPNVAMGFARAMLSSEAARWPHASDVRLCLSRCYRQRLSRLPAGSFTCFGNGCSDRARLLDRHAGHRHGTFDGKRQGRQRAARDLRRWRQLRLCASQTSSERARSRDPSLHQLTSRGFRLARGSSGSGSSGSLPGCDRDPSCCGRGRPAGRRGPRRGWRAWPARTARARRRRRRRTSGR